MFTSVSHFLFTVVTYGPHAGEVYSQAQITSRGYCVYPLKTQKKMKDSENVSTFVDRTLRIVQEDWQSTLMPKIPDWLLAHMMFANLTDELKNDMNEVYASYFQNGQRSFQSWCYSDVFSMATKCESSPKFQAEKRQQKQFTKSISAVDFANSGTSQNTKDDDDHGTNHNGTINRNAYYDVHKKK